MEPVWNDIESAPEAIVVRTKIDDAKGVRKECPLIRHGELWFIPETNIYIYYTPTHWTHA